MDERKELREQLGYAKDALLVLSRRLQDVDPSWAYYRPGRRGLPATNYRKLHAAAKLSGELD